MTPVTEPVGVLYVANSSLIGGGNRSFIDLISGLDRARFRPFLVAPTAGPLIDWAARHDVPHSIVPAGDWHGRVGLITRTCSLATTIVRTRARIVHAVAPTCYRAAGWAARLTGAARVCHLGYPPEPGELEWSFSVAPDVVIACHEGQAHEVRTRVQANAPAARLVSVPNGIDVDRFSPSAASSRLPDWHPLKPVVLIVGHLSEVKGYPTFFEAAARVVAAGEDCAFVALGGETASPGYRKVLDEHVRALGLEARVQFLGWQADVESVLRASDVVVLPSLAEGLPMAILEAMACARPIIATPVGGIPEAVSHESTGLLVPPRDADSLANAILRLIRDRSFAQRLGAQARDCAVSRFSVTRLVADVQAIYDGLCPPPRHHAARDASPASSSYSC